jgi:hypothetical protein
MPFTVSPVVGGSSPGQSTTQSLAIPAGSTVAVVCIGTVGGSGGAGAAGTCVDNNGVAYTPGNFLYNSGGGAQVSTFYNVNAPAATSLTFTFPAGYGAYSSCLMAAWVLSPSVGIVSFADSKAVNSVTFGTGANAVTTGNMSILQSDAIVLGFAFDANNTSLSAGSGMTSDGTTFQGVYEHAAVSAPSPATWTTSVGTDYILAGGLAFQLPAVTAVLPSGPMPRRKFILP